MKMNRELKPLGDKVMGKMIDAFDDKISKGGFITTETEGTDGAIRPRWFEVTHVGPGQQDVIVGDYVLVEHGRWTRGLDFYGTSRKEDFIFRIDEDGMFAVTKENPLDT